MVMSSKGLGHEKDYAGEGQQPRNHKEDIWDNQVNSLGESVKKRGSWKRAAVQRGLQPGSRRIAIVSSRYTETSSKRLMCVTVIYKVWRSAMEL
jgi:hypothetical protein